MFHIFCFESVDSPFLELLKNIILSRRSEDLRFFVNESMASIAKISPEDEKTVFFIDTRIRTKKHNNGFALAQALREQYPKAHIVFSSHFPEDMALCMRNLLRPSGFILKPASNAEVVALLTEMAENLKKQMRSKMLFISTHDFKRNVNIDQVIYFSTSGKKLFCKTALGEEIEFYETITNLHKRFPDTFLRCHHGFLVNKMYIKGVNRGCIELEGTSEILPISQKYKQDVMTYVGKNG